jgi:hypothetical protein
LDEILDEKVSPPFEGGVVGTIDYHIYTAFYFPTGVVDSYARLSLKTAIQNTTIKTWSQRLLFTKSEVGRLRLAKVRVITMLTSFMLRKIGTEFDGNQL